MDIQSGKKKALIIGGSGGLGKELAIKLDALGYEVIVTGTRKKGPENLPAGILYKEHLFTDNISVKTLIDQIPECDALAVCYGPLLMKSIDECSIDDWERINWANLVLPGSLISHYITSMQRKRFGRILLFGGSGSDRIRGYRKVAVYSGAKTALNVLAKSVSLSYGEMNISCNVICPGPVDTEYYDDAERKRLSAKMPGGKMLETRDFIKLYEILMNTGKIVMNGAIIPVDMGSVL